MSDQQSRSLGRKRILVAGAGVAGTSLAADAEAAGDTVVGFLDDVQTGSRILGRLADVSAVCGRESVDVVYFAIPSASAELIRRSSPTASQSGGARDHPRTYRVVSRDRVAVGDLTDIDVLDMVGRAPVKHDMVDARSAIAGKRVMVTGAAGSIGSRLVAQLHVLSQKPSCVSTAPKWNVSLGQPSAGSRYGARGRRCPV